MRAFFAPPLSVTTVPPSCFYATFSSFCEKKHLRNSVTTIYAKKRRKKSPSSTDENRGVGNSDDVTKQYPIVDCLENGTSNRNNIQPSEVVPKPKRTTLSGGPSLIFEMARRMLVWDDELYQSEMLNDAGSRRGEGDTESLAFVLSNPQSQPERLSAFPPSISTVSSLLSTDSTSPLPRWRPSAIRQQSVSNVNPAFRSSSPIMTDAGYACIMRRNSRKRNKPSMWRHCLRIYNKMEELENGIAEETGGGRATGDASYRNFLSYSSRNNFGGVQSMTKIKRGIAHHEAAMVAASKLGMWEEAINIFRRVESSISSRTETKSTGSNNRTINSLDDCITDHMILSVISACVKGSKIKHTATSSNAPLENSCMDGTNFVNGIDGIGSTNVTDNQGVNTTRRAIFSSRPIMMRALTIDERRKPLDMARDILLSLEVKHGIPLVARHINPLASAYNRLGLCSEASALINEHLRDRTPPPPPPLKKQDTSSSTKSILWREKRELVSDNPGFEGVPLVEWNDESLVYADGVDASLDDDDDGDVIERSQLNIHELKSKDRASYSLLVQSAAREGDWTNAVLELQRMTDAGFHPNSRDRNSWNEVMERGYRPAGNGAGQRRRSWKKKRDGICLGNLRD